MGRLYLVEFDRNPENQFYCCRVCRTHIALSRDCTGRSEEIRQGFFSKVVNLVFNEPCRSQLVDNEGQVDELHCARCNKHLGWGYIEPVPAHIAPVFVLKLDVLLFWDGQLFRKADQPMHPVGNQQGMRKILLDT